MENSEKVVLIVEDDEPTKSALKKKLETAGFIVNTAPNGEEGLKSVEKERPNIILLDMMMPVMDGPTTLKALKADEKTKDIPVCVLTNIDSDEKVAEVLENDAQDYLLKTDQTLESIIEYVVSKLS